MVFGMGMAPYTPMDREYSINEPKEPFGPAGEASSSDIERPIVSTSEIGTTVTEGSRFGTLNQQVTAAIRRGASRIELATGMGGGMEPVGVESYGQEARQDLRELARAANIEFTSVHTPTQVGNLSGFNPQEGGFSDQARQMGLDEVKKAITFAGDAAGGGAVVVHTGEFHRPMFDARWNKEGEWKDAFVSYDEEPEKAAITLVDDRTGQVIKGLNRSQIVYEPVFHTAANPASGGSLVGKYDSKKQGYLKEDDFVDMEGNWINPIDAQDMFNRVPVWNPKKSQFDVRPVRWDDYEHRKNKYNSEFGTNFTTDELFIRGQLENQVMQARGHSMYYAHSYEETKKRRDAALKALRIAEKIEREIPEEERWRFLEEKGFGKLIDQYVKAEKKLPSEILKEVVADATNHLEYINRSSASSDVQAAETMERINHITTAEKFAKQKTARTYAEAGVFALNETERNPNVKRNIFVAPENIFPEMGYGSHPEELIELVQEGRKEMAHLLTDRFVENPSGRRLSREEAQRWNRENPQWKRKEGEVALIANPYLTDMSYNEALEKAKHHIKATFDTQHLGMWWKHFKAEPGETEGERKKRFDKWYMDEVEKMAKAGILGHVHAVDSMGSTHTHLPPGQGVMPVVDAVTYLKKHGYDVSIVSEGHAEQADRQLFKAWQAFGNTIYSAARPGAPVRFGDVHESYFGHHRPPYFVHGQYSPSNDWTLWTQVPLE